MQNENEGNFGLLSDWLKKMSELYRPKFSTDTEELHHSYVCYHSLCISCIFLCVCVSVCVRMCVYLEGLDKSPEEDSNCLSLSQQLNETSSTKQAKEPHIDYVVLEKKRCKKTPE